MCIAALVTSSENTSTTSPPLLHPHSRSPARRVWRPTEIVDGASLGCRTSQRPSEPRSRADARWCGRGLTVRPYPEWDGATGQVGRHDLVGVVIEPDDFTTLRGCLVRHPGPRWRSPARRCTALGDFDDRRLGRPTVRRRWQRGAANLGVRRTTVPRFTCWVNSTCWGHQRSLRRCNR